MVQAGKVDKNVSTCDEVDMKIRLKCSNPITKFRKKKKKKRKKKTKDKSSQKKERKATQTLAIVLGKFAQSYHKIF